MRLASIHTPVEKRLPQQLVDNHGRTIDYLRLSVTDRCNLCCRYCMPASSMTYIPQKELLSFEELLRIVGIFASLGVKKIRLTGGEPLVREGLINFIAALGAVPGIEHIHLTTNGVTTASHLTTLGELGVSGINLSLDTMKPQRFQYITRRDALAQVLNTLHQAIAMGMPLKINTVMYQRVNADEIIPMANLAKEYPITVRFIEQMPFGGQAGPSAAITGNYIEEILRQSYPAMEERPASGTAKLYAIHGFAGQVGIIQGYSRHFCHTCNKVRITPAGTLKTCLYDQGALDLKLLLRTGAGDDAIKNSVIDCITRRAANGHVVEESYREKRHDSMATIGG